MKFYRGVIGPNPKDGLPSHVILKPLKEVDFFAWEKELISNTYNDCDTRKILKHQCITPQDENTSDLVFLVRSNKNEKDSEFTWDHAQRIFLKYLDMALKGKLEDDGGEGE